MQAMGCFQKLAAALVVASLSLLACEGPEAAVSGEPSSSAVQHQKLHMRKLLNISDTRSACYSIERMAPDGCSKEDVVVYQNNGQHLPSGIPTYSVQIINVCASCTVYDVHISCGEFASTELVNPSLFQRVGFNDCLVKGGGPMGPGETVSFQYSNSFAYPLDVASVSPVTSCYLAVAVWQIGASVRSGYGC